jgi:hypothetical protein
MNFNTFDIHFTLTFQSIGKKKNRQSYFIMKVTDFKKIDEGKVSKTSNTGISYLLYHGNIYIKNLKSPKIKQLKLILDSIGLTQMKTNNRTLSIQAP